MKASFSFELLKKLILTGLQFVQLLVLSLQGFSHVPPWYNLLVENGLRVLDPRISKTIQSQNQDDDNSSYMGGVWVNWPCFERVFSVDITAIWKRVVGFMRVFMEPWVSVDLVIPGEEGLVFKMLERVVAKRGLEGVISVFDSFDAQ